MDFNKAYADWQAEKSKELEARTARATAIDTATLNLKDGLVTFAAGRSLPMNVEVLRAGTVSLSHGNRPMEIRVDGPDSFYIRISVGNPDDRGRGPFTKESMMREVLKWLFPRANA
jgi:hypothetical protein